MVECEYLLKDDFKNDIIYKQGLVFSNERVLKSRKTIIELLPSVRNKDYIIDLSTGASSESSLFGDESIDKKSAIYSKRISFKEIADLNYSIVNKALRQFNIFKFNILQKYYPK